MKYIKCLLEGIIAHFKYIKCLLERIIAYFKYIKCLMVKAVEHLIYLKWAMVHSNKHFICFQWAMILSKKHFIYSTWTIILCNQHVLYFKWTSASLLKGGSGGGAPSYCFIFEAKSGIPIGFNPQARRLTFWLRFYISIRSPRSQAKAKRSEALRQTQADSDTRLAFFT